MEYYPISVIMSVYKEPGEWLRQSIDSILNQTFRDFEFIIICDNPNGKENIAILKEYAVKDSRIKLIFNEENIGLTKSLNKGLAASKGKYIARMDADDISMPMRFSKQFDYMESHKDVVVLGTAKKFIGKNAFFKQSDSIRFGNEKIKAQMLMENCIAHSSVFIRKSILDEHEITYDERYRHSQDYRLWEILMPYGKFENLKTRCLQYRLSPQQITSASSIRQHDLADGVRMRLQIEWLRNNNVPVQEEDLIKHPYCILETIRNRYDIKSQLEYKSFLQFVYLSSIQNLGVLVAVRTGDWRYITFKNLIRLIIKAFRNNRFK